ncbi:MAG: CoA transferase [Gammaproteobacteria bacterium]|nr:CoA transferase [Gammaproteobacteria bacterium]
MVAPFAGLRVVDLSTRFSGAFAARLFGDFGADVALAEPPEGHPLRFEPPFLQDQPGPDRSVVHAYVNWNKRAVQIAPNARIDDLIAHADVVVTTAAEPALADISRRLPPTAVHLSVTPHGLDDPLRGVPGNNLTMSARVGWSSINGYADEAPLRMPRDMSGVVGGVTGFITAAAALRRRNATGQAERVDVSELEAFALTVHPWGVASVYHGRASRGPGGGRRRGAPGPLWDLEDGQMNLGLADFHNWQQAMTVCNLPEVGARPELIPDIGRHSQDMRDVVHGLAETLPKLKRWDVFHALAKLRCVIGVVQDVEDLTRNEQFVARDFFVSTSIEGRSVRAGGAPARLKPSPWRLRKPAPRLGEPQQPDWQPRPEPAEPPKATAASPAGPLTDVRVLSFGQAWSGTFGTELLALLGADVVQIASTKHPDAFRRISNRVPAAVFDASRRQHPANTQGHYNAVNLHKREVNLDLTSAAGQDILWRLLPKFDVVVDNFRPTVLPKWGITLERLHEIKPGMVWASISGYGEDGPYRDYPANGATTEPMAGLSSLHGYAGDRGMNTGGLFPDPIGGYFLVATILAALEHRDRTGEAQRVDLSMMESVAAVVGDALVEYDATGRKPQPLGNHHPRIAPHNTYRTKGDDWLALATETESEWNALKSVVADARLDESRFADPGKRKENEEELDTILGAWCAERDAAETESVLNDAGVCAARVVPLTEIYSRPDPHFAAAGFIARIEHPEAGPTWLPGRPWRFSAAPSEPIRPAPCVGEHSREVFAQELGMTGAEYEALVASGVTGTLDEMASAKGGS